jgi:hypothetical protein
MNKIFFKGEEFNVIDLDKIKNSLIVLYYANEGNDYERVSEFVASLNKGYDSILCENKIAFVGIRKDEKFDVIDEKLMNKNGWYKKEENETL